MSKACIYSNGSMRVCVCVCEQVLHKIDVVETLQIENERLRIFRLTFHFLPLEHYCEDKLLSPQQILNYMETRSVCMFVCVCAHSHMCALMHNKIPSCRYCVC